MTHRLAGPDRIGIATGASVDRLRIPAMRLAPLAVSGTFAAAFWLLPAFACAQLAVEFGPRGEITRLSVGDTVDFENVAVSLMKPGWSGASRRAGDDRSRFGAGREAESFHDLHRHTERPRAIDSPPRDRQG